MRVRFKHSSNVYSADWSDNMLDITFKPAGGKNIPGETYRYYNVPRSVFEMMKLAPSAGQFVNVWIKQVGYKYAKLDMHQPPPTLKEIEAKESKISIEEVICNLEKKGLVRRELDEQGFQRVVVTGDLAAEILLVNDKQRSTVREVILAILKQNFNTEKKSIEKYL